MADIQSDLETLIRMRHAIVTIHTYDESFAVLQIRKAAMRMGLPVYEWSACDGIRRLLPSATPAIEGSDDLKTVLRGLRGKDERAIYIFKDALGFVDNPQVTRLLRELAQEYIFDSRTLFMIDHGGHVPDALEGLVMPYDLPLPDDSEIYNIIRDTYRDVNRLGKCELELTQKQFDTFRSNLLGLSRSEVAQVVAGAFLNDGKLDADDLATIAAAKRARLQKTGVLDYIAPSPHKMEIGGMATLRSWLKKRGRAFTTDIKKARDYGLQPPKGILMLGVQGCGKSLMAKAVASDWGVPLLRMDVGALYDKYVGESERHLRQAFAIASAMAPCVLWIDEIEKAFASASAGSAGAASDGGLSQRMFGQLLSWMQDRDEPVFIVATANDIAALPPEMMRKGRFDEIFFVDLPDKAAREQIFKAHLKRRKRKLKNFDLGRLATAAEGFSGSEIEQAVISAMFAAFADDREVGDEDILTEMSQTKPLSVVMGEKITELRNWAKGRCVPAG